MIFIFVGCLAFVLGLLVGQFRERRISDRLVIYMYERCFRFLGQAWPPSPATRERFDAFVREGRREPRP